jgi:hypothetical protein
MWSALAPRSILRFYSALSTQHSALGYNTEGAECYANKAAKKIRTLVTDMGKVVAYFCNSSDVLA